ncbi:MAG: hypothetical protein KGD66_03755 [Candidatus Lokiarchaeota archaeon]|nr:hypothetical protein [Candidatus Lokiarchaeota archaeon]
MAGIFVIYEKESLSESTKVKLQKCSEILQHRGSKVPHVLDRFPLKIIYYPTKKETENHQLYLVSDKENKKIVAIDGHIYNIAEINRKYISSMHSLRDKEGSILGLLFGYMNKGASIFNELIGSFSGILFNGIDLIGFKDPIGTKPLYYCESNKFMVFSSEMKALFPLKKNIKSIPPGCMISSSGIKETYYQFPKFIENYKLTTELVRSLANQLNILIKRVVEDNINKNEKVGILLSGGLGSIIISHIAKDIVEDLHLFTVGVEGSRDLFYATKYVKLHNLKHTSIKIKKKDLLSVLPDIIYALESFDAALVRSSLPMFLLCKQISEENNIDLLLTGEGADELFGGYEYLTKFKSPKDFNKELLNLLKIEYKTGLQKVDRIPYNFSVEARAPLFDKRIVEFSFKIPTELKILKRKGVGIARKWILRKSFETEISEEFIWRKKQKSSDGVGSQFVLRDQIEKIITDEEFEKNKNITSSFSLRSKEELYYWRIFKTKFQPTPETISEIGITKVYYV